MVKTANLPIHFHWPALLDEPSYNLLTAQKLLSATLQNGWSHIATNGSAK
jgi:hypothetical protein